MVARGLVGILNRANFRSTNSVPARDVGYVRPIFETLGDSRPSIGAANAAP
jgi:hypothetical protein